MDAEFARTLIEDIEFVKKRPRLTLLFDGWEDKLKRSLYRTVVAGIGEFPTVLGLEELTGLRGTADTYLETIQKAMRHNEIEEAKNIIALTTDDPNVMQAFRRKFKNIFFWVLVSPSVDLSECDGVIIGVFADIPMLLHNLNTIIGKIVSCPSMKQVATKSARIVYYFNSTHYWGGQLDKEAKSLNITRGLKTNTESRWYSLILQAISVDSYR
jgi:hypothetical protein